MSRLNRKVPEILLCNCKDQFTVHIMKIYHMMMCQAQHSKKCPKSSKKGISKQVNYSILSILNCIILLHNLLFLLHNYVHNLVIFLCIIAHPYLLHTGSLGGKIFSRGGGGSGHKKHRKKYTSKNFWNFFFAFWPDFALQHLQVNLMTIDTTLRRRTQRKLLYPTVSMLGTMKYVKNNLHINCFCQPKNDIFWGF